MSKKMPLWTNCRINFTVRVASHEGQQILAKIIVPGEDSSGKARIDGSTS